MNVEKLMSHAASMSNPPKSYGGLEAGIAVIRYRSQRLRELGWPTIIDYEDAIVIVEKEILEKFGAPK